MPSFDVVSRVDLQEVDNAINQARRELDQRFDFKGSGTNVKLDDGNIQIQSADDFKVKAAVEVVKGKLARRGVSLKALVSGPVEPGPGGTAKQRITVQQGESTERAREIVKLIKRSKLKVLRQYAGQDGEPLSGGQGGIVRFGLFSPRRSGWAT